MILNCRESRCSTTPNIGDNNLAVTDTRNARNMTETTLEVESPGSRTQSVPGQGAHAIVTRSVSARRNARYGYHPVPVLEHFLLVVQKAVRREVVREVFAVNIPGPGIACGHGCIRLAGGAQHHECPLRFLPRCVRRMGCAWCHIPFAHLFCIFCIRRRTLSDRYPGRELSARHEDGEIERRLSRRQATRSPRLHRIGQRELARGPGWI